MTEKTCIITGANAGIGKAAAIQIAQRGYRVIMACRNPERGEWATNHIGPVLLTDLLLPALKRSEQGRIITISSKGLMAYPFLKVDLEDPEFRQGKFSVQKAYYQSKLAQVMVTYWLAEKLKDTGTTANAIRVTNVRVDIDKRYPDMPKLMRKMYAIKSSFSITPEEMAETYTYLATSDEVSQTTGKYYDNPSSIVNSSGYSRVWENLEAVMALTRGYLPENVLVASESRAMSES